MGRLLSFILVALGAFSVNAITNPLSIPIAKEVLHFSANNTFTEGEWVGIEGLPDISSPRSYELGQISEVTGRLTYIVRAAHESEKDGLIECLVPMSSRCIGKILTLKRLNL